MSDQLVIDTLDFVRNGKALRGSIPLHDLQRLGSYLLDSTGELTYEISGQLDDLNRPMLEITVNATLDLSCQRCLKTIGYVLDVKTTLLLARTEDELALYDEDIFVDAIYASNELDILALVEDEAILSLPVSPRHEDTGCHISAETETHEDIEKKHPFSILASLKHPH